VRRFDDDCKAIVSCVRLACCRSPGTRLYVVKIFSDSFFRLSANKTSHNCAITIADNTNLRHCPFEIATRDSLQLRVSDLE
jgi:hypothetical protein